MISSFFKSKRDSTTMEIEELLNGVYIPSQVSKVCEELESTYDDLLSKNSSRYRENHESGKEVLDRFKNALDVLIDDGIVQETPLFLEVSNHPLNDNGEPIRYAMRCESIMFVKVSLKGAARRRAMFEYIVNLLNAVSDLRDPSIGFMPDEKTKTVIPSAFVTSTLSKINEIVDSYDEEDDEDEEYGEIIENLQEFLSAVEDIQKLGEC